MTLDDEDIELLLADLGDWIDARAAYRMIECRQTHVNLQAAKGAIGATIKRLLERKP